MKSLRARLRPRRHDRGSDEGFTLVELVVALGLIGVVFAAVAAIMTSSLRTLAVQKARTQGNEVATQAIEDLQRRDFDGLVLCELPSGTAPSGLDNRVEGPACPSPLPAGYGEDPCNGLNAGQAPKAQYTCTRSNIDFLVKRYIAWTDVTQTNKRLAVFVTWRDAAGLHEVSQQSSLRAPNEQSIIGLLNPTLSSATTTQSVSIDDAGALTSSLTFQVFATDLGATDKVFANFYNLDAEGNFEITSVELSSGNGALWTTTLSSGLKFPEGTQAISFTALREKDGKTAATVGYPASTFCKPTTSPCVGANLISNTPTTSTSTVALSATGGQVSDFSVSVVTDSVPANGQVQLLLPSLGGVQTMSMTPSSSCGSTSTSSCTWTATVPKSAGYAFSTGKTRLHVVAAQPYVVGSTNATERGMTDSDSVEVTFSG